MATTVKETIQNRVTNQSAAWGIITALMTPLITYFAANGFAGPADMQNLIFTFAMTAMMLLFIRSDKMQEHSNAAAALTTPKILEQSLDKQIDIMEGYVAAFKEAIEVLQKTNGNTEVVEKIVYVESQPDNMT